MKSWLAAAAAVAGLCAGGANAADCKLGRLLELKVSMDGRSPTITTAINGREAIRAILAQLIDRETKIEVQASTVLSAGEVALGSERWAIRSAGAEGQSFEQHSSPTLVLRAIEGAWKLAIAAPWGRGVAAPCL